MKRAVAPCGLWQIAHPSTIYDGVALQARSNRLIGRGCVNCHQNIHGSNHPSGQTLTR